MSDEDLISALNQAVRQEVLENYLRERRIIEEEGNILLEACSAFHGGLSAWDQHKLLLSRALLTPDGAARFFALAGLTPPPEPCLRPELVFIPPRVLGRCRRHQKLIEQLYRDMWDERLRLNEERRRVMDLRQEVNEDILSFERNHDLLTLSAYLRSLDPQELQRRKILGVNFTAKETAASAENLSFRPFSLERLGLDHELDSLRAPDDFLPTAQGLIRELCRMHPRLVDQLWS